MVFGLQRRHEDQNRKWCPLPCDHDDHRVSRGLRRTEGDRFKFRPEREEPPDQRRTLKRINKVIYAADSETLLVKPMETELADLDGLKSMSGTAAENYAGVALEFEFGWDKSAVLADVRDAMSKAEAEFPDGAEQYTINEINFSEFPIIIVNLTGPVPERTMVRVAKDLQDKLEAVDAVLEAGIAGSRDEMLEVLIDPLRLEAYNVTAGDLINAVVNNNN